MEKVRAMTASVVGYMMTTALHRRRNLDHRETDGGVVHQSVDISR